MILDGFLWVYDPVVVHFFVQNFPGVCGHWRLRCQSTFDTRHGAGDHHGGHTVLPEPRGAFLVDIKGK